MARPQTKSSLRINKYLADAGICSRRKADELIQQGSVQVNGKICQELGFRVNPQEDRVKVQGKLVRPTIEKVYIAFNKPKNVVTTTSDPLERRSVMDYFKKSPVRLFPVGRLDWATEGLLLVTNDGEFSNEVASPRSKVPKTYLAKLDGQPSRDQLGRLLKGVSIAGGGRVKALEAKRIKHGTSQKYDWVQLTILEGKNRQIRKMFEKIGFDVKKLQRISIGGLRLGRLRIGQYKILTTQEINKIFADPNKTTDRSRGNRKSEKKKALNTSSSRNTTQRRRSVKK